MTCTACGATTADSAAFCPACGTALKDAGEAATVYTPPLPSPRPTSSPTRLPSPTTTPGPRAGGGRFGPGAVLASRYQILGLLGRGGMGEVYRAEDLSLGQSVALKFLPDYVAVDAGRLARFRTEVSVARQVSHPNVCRVYDIGEADGHVFLSMEYVDGEDLASLLRRIGRLAPDKAAEMARQLCAGLAAAHDKGVLHRDLKPANVMIDGRGHVRLADFGLAGGAEVETPGLAGTPAYMAPEQFAGQAASVKSDIYALGLVLYEMFTGKAAFSGSTANDLARQHREATPTSLTQVVSEIDPVVDRVIQRCLAKDPSDRPASALAVSAALPGGDPLAAALAAGETPSPALVAASGGVGALQPLTGDAVVPGDRPRAGAGRHSQPEDAGGALSATRSPAGRPGRCRPANRRASRILGGTRRRRVGVHTNRLPQLPPAHRSDAGALRTAPPRSAARSDVLVQAISIRALNRLVYGRWDGELEQPADSSGGHGQRHARSQGPPAFPPWGPRAPAGCGRPLEGSRLGGAPARGGVRRVEVHDGHAFLGAACLRRCARRVDGRLSGPSRHFHPGRGRCVARTAGLLPDLRAVERDDAGRGGRTPPGHRRSRDGLRLLLRGRPRRIPAGATEPSAQPR